MTLPLVPGGPDASMKGLSNSMRSLTVMARLGCMGNPPETAILPRKVPDDPPGPQNILLGRPPTDVMDDGAAVGDQADVRQAAAQVPGDDVAGLEVLVERQGFATALEELHQIRHAPVIDVRVGFVQAPFRRVGAEALRHVFVHE